MMNGYLNHRNDEFYYVGFPLDVIEEDDSYVIRCEVPGVEKENIHVVFQDGILTIEAKRKHEKDHNKYFIHERNNMNMKREINFGDFEEESISAKLLDGILTITIKKQAPKPKKAIEIM